MNIEYCAASVMGRHHATAGKNNQDAFVVRQSPEATIAVVSDGCGSGKYSEFGARVMANTMAIQLQHYSSLVYSGRYGYEIAQLMTEIVSCEIRRVIWSMAGSHDHDFVFDHMLATCIAAIITPNRILVLRCGDGVVYAHDILSGGRESSNTPDYFAYRLNPHSRTDMAARPRFVTIFDEPFPHNQQPIMIGTDGAFDYLNVAMNDHTGLPTIGELFTNDAYYKNPDLLRRKLFKASRDKPDFAQGRIIPGLLHDDTTMIVLRGKA